MKVVMIALICWAAIGWADWIELYGVNSTAQEPLKKIVSSDTTGITVRAVTYGFNESDTIISDSTYQRIAIPRSDLIWDTSMTGKPQLPYVTLLIAVPDSCDLSITPCYSGPVVLDGYSVYPIPRMEFIDTLGCLFSKEVFVLDTAFYEKDTVFPDKFYEITNDGHWRGQRIIEVHLYPIQYNPLWHRLFCYNDLSLNVIYSGEKFNNEDGLGPLENLGRDLILNYPGVDTELGYRPEPSVHVYDSLKNPDNIADYIIVSHDIFLLSETGDYWITQLAQWRVDHNNFDISVVSMTDVYAEFLSGASGDSAKALRDFLVYAYHNWDAPNMTDNHFGYCLLIGDWRYVPIKTDLVYYENAVVPETKNWCWWLTAFEGYYRDIANDGFDGYDDIMLGRWPVNTIQDLITIAQKTIRYEQTPDTTGNWRRRGLVIGGGGEGITLFHDMVSYSNQFISPIGYDTLTLRWDSPDSLGFSDSIHAYLDSGEIVAAYYGHSGPNGLPPDYFWNSDPNVTELVNGDSLPVIFSNSCNAAMFQRDHAYYDTLPGTYWKHYTCFAEHFLYNPNGGGVAFYGGASPIYLDYYSYFPIKRIFWNQYWLLGQAIINTTENNSSNCFCLLGDPALDLGDFTAYPLLPDLVVRTYDVESPDISIETKHPYHTSGWGIPIRAKILNIGRVAAQNIEVTIKVTLHSETSFEASPYIQEIAPQDSAVINVIWNTSETHPNKYGPVGDTIWVTVDPENSITESWEGNNIAFKAEPIALYPNLPAWPIKLFNASSPQPALTKVDIEVDNEVITVPLIVLPANESLFVFDAEGNNFTGWPKWFAGIKNIVIGDVDNDSKPEIVAISDTYIRLYRYDGEQVWERFIPQQDYRFSGFPALGYIGGDYPNSLQIIVYKQSKPINDPLPGRVIVYNVDGSIYKEFVTSISFEKEIYSLGPSVSDVNGDSKNEIILAAQYETLDPPVLTVYTFTDIFNDDDTLPIYTINNLGDANMIPALNDINDDGIADIVAGSGNGKIQSYVYDNGSMTELWSWTTEGAIKSSPAIGEIDPSNQVLETAFGNDANNIHLRQCNNGYTIEPFPIPLTLGSSITTSPALARLEGIKDASREIIIGSNNQWVYAYKYTGSNIDSFPLPIYGNLSSTVIGDVNSDGKSETVLTTSDGYLHVWKNLKSYCGYWNLEWPQFHHDYQRTGLYGWTGVLQDGYASPATFSTATTLTFTLKNRQSVRIRIYNENGTLVRSLVNQLLPAGSYHPIWDGRNSNFALLPNGIYLIEIKVRNETKIIPVTITR